VNVRVGQKLIEKHRGDLPAGKRRIVQVVDISGSTIIADCWYEHRTEDGWAVDEFRRRRTRFGSTRLRAGYEPLRAEQ
jgi:hypothetical protein